MNKILYAIIGFISIVIVLTVVIFCCFVFSLEVLVPLFDKLL